MENGQWYKFNFALSTDQQVQAAGQWAKLLAMKEREIASN
jgi:hypothetical protein